ncbi:pectin acetylesterase 5 [Selaginella moellendorffii]|nr:pectin acetylesterase 5 [Selaginella moellendorffii]|eukprot:XP_002965391.2 pectin acetylesterase 5 [Selaginella moellendorffii]
MNSLLFAFLALVFGAPSQVSPTQLDGVLVEITYLSKAKSLGAVCLDGSVPAYHIAPGGANWLISLEGGGWCESEQSCAARAGTALGSSVNMQGFAAFSGQLSSDPKVNTDFHNWTHVFVRYCDGASFSADVAEPLTLPSGQVLYFRGKRIFKAVIDELKSMGLSDATQVLLSGCSAGGLATVHRCNELQSFLPRIKLKCLSDGGFFLNVSDISGNYSMSSYYNSVVKLHQLEKTLDSSCVSSRAATECFFPQTMKAFVQPPLFLLNAAYDYWQLEHVKKIPRDQYVSCMNSLSCPAVKKLQEFRTSMIGALSASDWNYKSSLGVFFDSCFTHCHARGDDKWNNIQVNGKSVSQTVGDWYFDRDPPQLVIDCAFPCNPTCIPVFD